MAILNTKRANFIALFASLGVVGCNQFKTTVERPANQSHETSPAESSVAGLDVSGSVKPQRLMDWVGILEKMMEQDQGKNAVCSPASMEIALGIIYAGADDSSRNEMKAALWSRFENSDAIIKAHEGWIRDLNRSAGGAMGKVANSLWHQNQIDLNKAFSSQIKSKYGADIYLIDPNPSRANKDFQEWMTSSQAFPTTDFKSVFEQNVRIALFNTIHFKGKWQRAFDKSRTREDTFNTPSGAIRWRFMRDNGKYLYEQTDSYQAVSIPMADKSTQMQVFLPKVGHSISDVVNSLKTDPSAGRFQNAAKRNVALKIPIGKTVRDYRWIGFLKNLGIKRIFESDGNPLSNMTLTPNIHVGFVHQQTILEYNEDGAEGSTVSHFSMYDTIPGPEDQEIDFSADRPFLYSIQRNGLILFLGILSNPEE